MQERTVAVERHGGRLGLCIRGGAEFGAPAFIWKITKRSPGALRLTSRRSSDHKHRCRLFVICICIYFVADRNGQLRVGDKIVRVNGVCTVSLAHDEVADLLRCGGDPLTLTIQRLQSTNMFAWFGSARRLAKRLSSTFQNHVLLV